MDGPADACETSSAVEVATEQKTAVRASEPPQVREGVPQLSGRPGKALWPTLRVSSRIISAGPVGELKASRRGVYGHPPSVVSVQFCPFRGRPPLSRGIVKTSYPRITIQWGVTLLHCRS